MDLITKSLDSPDEKRAFEKGTFELVTVGGFTVGRATYQPGWKWSQHVGPNLGETTCNVAHVVLGVSGCAKVRMDDGAEFEITPGVLCAIPPGHDSWVEGDEPYVSLHFMGAEEYARA